MVKHVVKLHHSFLNNKFLIKLLFVIHFEAKVPRILRLIWLIVKNRLEQFFGSMLLRNVQLLDQRGVEDLDFQIDFGRHVHLIFRYL